MSGTLLLQEPASHAHKHTGKEQVRGKGEETGRGKNDTRLNKTDIQNSMTTYVLYLPYLYRISPKGTNNTNAAERSSSVTVMSQINLLEPASSKTV